MPAFPVDQVKSNATIKLTNGVRYTLAKPMTIGGSKPVVNCKITTTNPTGKPFTLEFRPADKVWDAVTLAGNSAGCLIDNIILDTKPSTRGVNVQGTGHTISRLTTTDRSHCAVFVDGATDITIKDFDQKIVVPVGYFYARNARRITICNGETWGNYYENEFRLHACNDVKFINVRAYAANPQNDVDWNKDGNDNEGDKDNAFRLHDSDNVLMDGCVATGYDRFGPMGDYNGGQEMYENSINVNKYPKQADRDRFRAEWQRQMAQKTTKLMIRNCKFYGWIRLEAGLVNAVFDNCEVYAPGAGSIIRVDPEYKAGSLTRLAPTATWNHIKAYSLAIPGAEKAAMKGPYDIVALCDKYARLGKFNSGVNMFSNAKGMTTSDVQINVKKV